MLHTIKNPKSCHDNKYQKAPNALWITAVDSAAFFELLLENIV